MESPALVHEESYENYRSDEGYGGRYVSPRPTTARELFELAEQDPEPYIEGSVDEFYAARHRGLVSDEEYAVLARAIADGMDAEDQATHE